MVISMAVNCLFDTSKFSELLEQDRDLEMVEKFMLADGVESILRDGSFLKAQAIACALNLLSVTEIYTERKRHSSGDGNPIEVDRRCLQKRDDFSEHTSCYFTSSIAYANLNYYVIVASGWL